MYKEEIDKLLAVNQESEQRLLGIVNDLKRDAESYSKILINCATNHDLPQQIEQSLLDLAAGYIVIVKHFEETTQETNLLSNQTTETIILNFEIMEKYNLLLQEKNKLQEAYNKAEKRSIFEFLVWKVRQLNKRL